MPRFALTAAAIFLLTLLCAQGAYARGRLVLLPPPEEWVPGDTQVLEVLATGGVAPDTLKLILVDGSGGIEDLRATRTGDPSGTRYALQVPDCAPGAATLRLAGQANAPYAIRVLPVPTTPPALPPESASPQSQTNTAPSLPPPDSKAPEPSRELPPPPLQFSWLDAFYSHEPLYFLTGIAPEVDVKFQLSFKYQLFTTEPGIPKRIAEGWVAPTGLYFTYTQTSIWDILEESSPFRDTSYKPGVYWQVRDVWAHESDHDRFRLSLQAGFEHESNGRGEPESRSINLAVLRPTLGYAAPSGWRFLFSPKLYAYIEKTDNQDIDRFRGYADLHFTARSPSADANSGLQVALRARLGDRASRNSLQADISDPARKLVGMPGFLTFQVFTGYGETILDYDKRYDTQYRIGFSAIR